MAECGCCGGEGPKYLFYACSGAANTGLLADKAARVLSRTGLGKMTCLAAMGAELSGFTETARSVQKNIVLDGCKISCGRKIFERLGIPCEQHIMTDFGVEKGKTEITDTIIAEVADKISGGFGRGCGNC